MKSPPWICGAIVGLTLAVPAGVRARQPAGDPASSVAFYSVYAKLSLSLHDRDPKTADPMAIYQDLVTKCLPTPFLEGTHFPASFTQLSNPNYTAAYYAYMWSLVVAKDLFSQFDRNDLLSPNVARRYRDTILAQAGAKPAAQLVRDFLGRPFNFSTWEARNFGHNRPMRDPVSVNVAAQPGLCGLQGALRRSLIRARVTRLAQHVQDFCLRRRRVATRVDHETTAVPAS